MATWSVRVRACSGDRVRRVAAGLAGAVHRSTDVVARYGGEEFALILPDTSLGGALIIAQKARQAVRQLALPHTGSDHGQVTVSAGLASLIPQPGQNPGMLIEQADRALYRAKHAGRDQVCKYDPTLA